MLPEEITQELLGNHVEYFDNRTQGDIRRHIEADRKWTFEQMDRLIVEAGKQFPKRFLPIRNIEP